MNVISSFPTLSTKQSTRAALWLLLSAAMVGFFSADGEYLGRVNFFSGVINALVLVGLLKTFKRALDLPQVKYPLIVGWVLAGWVPHYSLQLLGEDLGGFGYLPLQMVYEAVLVIGLLVALIGERAPEKRGGLALAWLAAYTAGAVVLLLLAALFFPAFEVEIINDQPFLHFLTYFLSQAALLAVGFWLTVFVFER